MTGPKLYGKPRDSAYHEDLCSPELCKVTQATSWIHRRFLTPRLRKATHHFCTTFGFPEIKIQ